MERLLGRRSCLDVTRAFRRLAESYRPIRRATIARIGATCSSAAYSLARCPRATRSTATCGTKRNCSAGVSCESGAHRVASTPTPNGWMAKCSNASSPTASTFYRWSTGEVGHVHLGLFGKYRVQRTEHSPDPIGQVRMRLQVEPGDDVDHYVTVDLSGPTACSIDPPSVRRDILARLGPDPIRRGSKPDAMLAKVTRSSRGSATS